MSDTMKSNNIVTRVEVIDGTGRAYVKTKLQEVILAYQDDGRTLKIFVREALDDNTK